MKIISKGADARKHLQNGINLVADCLKITLGPQGRNATLGRVSTLPLTTNDGKTVSDYIEAEDESDQLGVLKAREASTLSEQQAGDGTTTVSVLLQAITNHCLNIIDNNNSLVMKDKVNVVAMRKEISDTCELIVEELRKQAKPVIKKDEILKVAKASVENDELAKIITEIFLKIGKDGSIFVEEGFQTTEYEIVCGMDLNVGLLSDDFLFDTDDIELKDADIYVSKQPIRELDEVLPKIHDVSSKGGQKMVIMATDFAPNIVESFIKNNLEGGIEIYPVKITNVDKNYKIEDIIAMIGGDLGKVDTVKLTTSSTSILGGKGDVKKYVQTLQKEYDTTSSEFDKESLQKRISALSGGTAIIKVGAFSQSDREYLRDKLEDAVLATKYAMQEGVVAGGGLALKKVAETLPINILTEAIKAPYNQIQENAGGKLEISKDIVDPVRVTICALRNACSVAGIVITSEITIADKNEKQGTKTESGETLS